MESNCENKPKPGLTKEYLRSSAFLKPFLATLSGAILGFAYYYFVGCASGTCGITSSPYMSTLFGGFLGYFIVSSPCTRC
jgi:hypothetical protein